MALKKNIHETTIEDLSAYLDRRLDAPAATAVEAHLASCVECVWEKETLEQTRRLLAQMPRVAPPRSFVLREAQVSAPAKTGFFTSARMLYLRGATAAAGVLLAVVVAGDVWLRPTVMPMASAPAPQSEFATFGAAAEPLPTEQSALKAAPPPSVPQPEGTPTLDAAATAAPATTQIARGVGGGPEETPMVAGSELAVNERDATHAPFWADLRIWRVAEGALGAMFVALVAITATGWRRIARLG